MRFLKYLNKKILCVFVTVLIFSLFFIAGSKEVHATLFPDINQYKKIVQCDSTKQACPQSLETWTYNVGYNMVYSISDWMLCLYSCKEGSTQNNSGASGGNGLQGMLALTIGAMYDNKPASGVEYLAYLKSSLGIGQPTYAQGLGTQLLDSAKLLDPWVKFRNVAYVFFVAVLVAIGFMIMFRFKINPQTVASVQDALPKIAFSLILVTLSYAIAGFMIDIAWVGNYLIKEVVAPSNNIFGSGMSFGNPANPEPSVGAKTFPSAWPFDVLQQFGGENGVVGQLTKGLNAIVGGIFQQRLGNTFTGIFNLVLAFTVVGATIKIFFSLLAKYVTLILMALFLPFSFLWGCLPGQEDTAPKSIMTMLSAALAFPATTLLLSIAYYFSKLAGNPFAKPPIPGIRVDEIAPLYFYDAFGKAGAGGVVGEGIAGGLIAIGILTIIPSIPQVIDDALQVKAGGLGAGVQELTGGLRRLPVIGSFLG